MSKRTSLSKSEAGCFLLCPQKHYYAYHVKARPVTNWPGAREFGIAFHEALKTYYTTGDIAKTLDTWEVESQQWNLNLTNQCVGEVLLIGWAARFPLTEYELLIIEDRKEIQIEDFSFKFVLDLLIRHRRTGELIVVDHKTTSSNIYYKSRFWTKLGNSLQARSYILALQQEGYDVKKIRFCTVRLPKEPMLKAIEGEPERFKRNCKNGKKGEVKPGQRLTDETPVEYIERLFNLIAKNPDKYYQERDFEFSPDDIDRTRDELKLLFELTETGRQIRNDSACFAFNNKCEYYGVCWEGDDIEDETLYEIRTNGKSKATPEK